ncbi:bifunctional adenosylcobinamide kinase/adenosylcobinamide-phosphate guanylyltransferase [Anaerosporobacter sp.]|uniref:bifunctional adenosylcobinamide kinase/adenosylcobinamide-phosphate guanylyltransferase n=1 Tax=Anaerosporobacter sp. TaxID=1872529 RepID=UPI00286F79FE|nr:bifunctional adenosylcobinamide kinase/adenosylcobinamide-phosphate guanylyltransferase [Anaerosporobacter sp.]
MMTLVTGGSGSGKSEFAENRTLAYSKEDLIYIATMVAFDKEAERKIARHREMRKEKNFTTRECYVNLKSLELKQENTVLLDCMSNLVANEMYQENGSHEDTVKQVIDGVMAMKEQVKNVVIVTNEVFSDGVIYDEETNRYIDYLGAINKALAEMADEVIEVVYTIPIYHKGGMLRC